MKNTYHVIKDPVHGSMQFTNEENAWIKPFIDTPNFQRLRHIKQLGMGDLIFPGATHTRFNHCLGCCYVASQIARKLELSTEERKRVMIAGLLHDIGHGPFSHAFEGIFYKKSIKHEDWTPLFLEEFKTDQKNDAVSAKDFDTISNLIMHQEKKHKLLADIVSSQLDADRLDYLRRDSHFCGVTYGDYDFRWLLHCLTVVKDKKGQNRLGVTVKGIGVVEQYLMARRLMMQNVYQNGKKYAAEGLLAKFLKYLAHSITDENLFQEVKTKNLAQFLKAVTEYNHKAKDSDCSEEHKQAFLKANYHLYKRLCDYDIFSMIRYFANLEGDHPVITIAKRLYHRKLPKVEYIDEANLPKVRERINALKENKSIEPWQVSLIALPHQAYFGSQDPILVLDKKGQSKNIHEYSLVLEGISDRLEKAYFLFFDADIKDFESA